MTISIVSQFYIPGDYRKRPRHIRFFTTKKAMAVAMPLFKFFVDPNIRIIPSDQ
jgi:hypothetical protein